MIVAPKTIRPGYPYAVSVHLMNVLGKAIIELHIKNSKNQSIDRISVRDIETGKNRFKLTRIFGKIKLIGLLNIFVVLDFCRVLSLHSSW